MCNRLASINPSFLCKGLSQSTLIQWSFCKRLIYFHGKSGRSHGNTSGVSSFTDLDTSYYYEKLSSLKEKPKQGRLVKGGYEFRGLGPKRKKQFLSNVSDDSVDDVEVMLSLLTDEVGLEDIGVCDGKKKKNVVSGVAKRDLKCDEVVKVRSMEEDDWRQRKERRKTKMQNLPKTANLDSSKERSNCSIESGKDFEVKSEGCIDEVVGNADGGHECDKEEVKILEKKDTVKGYYGESVGVSQDWRKKSEKKLNEEFSQHQLNVSENIEDSSRQEHSYEADRFTDESGSRMKYKRFEESSGKDYSVIESTSSSQKQYNGAEKKLKVISEVSKSRMNSWEENSTQVSDGVEDSREEKHQKTDHLVRLTTEFREKSQQMLGISDTHVTNSGNTSFSHRKSDVSMEKQKRHSETSEFKVSDNCSISGMKLVEGTTDEGVSETELRKSNEAKLVNEEGEQDKLKTSDDGSESFHQKENGARHSSQGSGPKGPSDEMWHVTDASTQEPSETDAPENTSCSSENDGAIKTSGRSLWTIIGDVVRSRWPSPRSGSRTPNSGGAKGSSYLSASSEAWFSGQEPDDSIDDNVKNRSTKGQSRNSGGLDSPLPSSNNDGSSRNTSLPIIEESSFPLSAIRMRRSPSPAIRKTSQAGETDTSIEELKRRKLVSIDRLGWEEAYTLEVKQRKNDEKFMREALLEAKKASDIWEVPVGAVLVQGDKIIARGHNLVEELHDSTAHAEMICIPEASTNLRSWRLLDTTLYVTLEPCPMCAGAILQARIGTIVWGAPNKLLGADGSWIRLFGDGDGGNGSMPTDKPPVPAHPFHPNMAVRRGVLAAECGEVMQHFFRLRRKKKTEPEPEPPAPPSSHHHHSNFLSKMHHAFNIIFCL
ncbi:tRNA(adenine(34)) deaminase, chloroplastic-like [Cynara cardunculus var. scolymus]|uniref:tRNA(adenine(34)) deaminase, chloroplastic-like n=1 Tax=Cynara cardunculus var. scolymus TaxID=59895 RepID=UPI000D62FA3C|nr:tRNA(adenine(34)) deaminase, chloroplastic-like [Cynara cardunculus var. scolymus]